MHIVIPLLAYKAVWLALCGGPGLAHVHAGLAIYALSQLVWKRHAARNGLLCVALATILNEAAVAAVAGSWHASARLSPALATMIWPTSLFLLRRVRRWRWVEAQRQPVSPGATALAPVSAPPVQSTRTLRLVASSPAARAPRTGSTPRLRVFPGYAARTRV